MTDEYRIFVGYDPRESVAYHVFCQSVLDHTDAQVSFHPVRGERRDGSNDFIYARFLVPWMCGFHGHALFADGDMVVRADIRELFALKRSDQGAQVVKHNYKTKCPVKYLGNKNEDYPRKNWSSVVLWNCNFYPNRILTPQYVASKPGSFLHRFLWLDDSRIGALPPEWNRLVLEEPLTDGDKIRHHTIGSPCFPEYASSDPDWWGAYDRMNTPNVNSASHCRESGD
jgi:hypothetical protein